MKKILSRLLLLLAWLVLPFNLFSQSMEKPAIPGMEFNIVKFGAVADGKTNNTSAIQNALDDAGKHGGKVIVPEGVFLSGPLKIPSLINLVISHGAVLKLINDVGVFPTEGTHYQNFLEANGVHDLMISGNGTIDGQGEIWWNKYDGKSLTLRRPQMIYIANSTRVEIAGVKLLNPPNTHISLRDCSNVFIHHIRIEAPANSHNTDGINFSGKNYTIDSCDIRTGDDNIALNFGSRDFSVANPECENISISNCTFGWGHGLSVGSFTAGGLRNLKVSNCTFDGTTSGIRIKSARGRGGLVENLYYENIKIRNSRNPIFISAYYPREPNKPTADSTRVKGEFIPTYKNIVLKNIEVSDCENSIILWGLPEAPIEHITIDGLVLTARNGVRIFNVSEVRFLLPKISIGNNEKMNCYKSQVIGYQ